MLWAVSIKSKKKISNSNKDFIADLIDNEAHHVFGDNEFILHDILEGKKFSEAIIEGNKIAAVNLREMLRANIPYDISYKRIN